MSTKTLIYGTHAVEALLSNPGRRIDKLFVQASSTQDAKRQKIIELAQSRQIPISILSSQQLNQSFGTVVHQGVIAEAAPLPVYHESGLKEFIQQLSSQCCILILDGITDPHNLGACLRTADAAGVHAVIIPKDKSASLNATVSKVACGAMESVPVFTVTNLARTLETLAACGVWIYGAAGEAQQSIWNIDFRGPSAIVLGSEGQGMRRLTREYCDELFSIPLLGQVSSLNVSVAAGICLFEVVRQRQTFA